MFRKFVLVCAIMASGLSVAAAQSCQSTIDTRQSLMKRSAAMAKVGAAMIKGETPFDLAKAKEILAAFADDAGKMPTLFPECSKTGDHTTVSPVVWEKPGEFKAAIAKFAADVKVAQENTKDLDTFKTGFQAIGKNCGSCHQTFRVRPS